ncbi:MAG: hypothetical protein AB7S26_34645 [Sandaracinaceae bacterium]
MTRTASIAVALTLAGCFNHGGATRVDDGAVPSDGGPQQLPGDDGGTFADASGTLPPNAESDDPDVFTGLGGNDFGACFDGVDNDSDGIADCSDINCRLNAPSCCVGAAATPCCDPGAMIDVPIAGCSGAWSGCSGTETFTAFGARTPEVSRFGADGTVDAWTPRGDAISDGGAVHDILLDPRAGTIRVHARIAAGDATSVDEVESLGVGFVDMDTQPGSLIRVEPAVALLVSRNRQRAILVVAGESMREVALPDAGPHTYELSVAPTGDVELVIDPSGAGTHLDARVSIDRPLRLALFGRTPDASAEPPRLFELSLTQDRCDMPAALAGGGLVVPAPSDPDPTWTHEVRSLERPSVLLYDDGSGLREWMVLVADGSIRLARPAAGGYVDALDAPAIDASAYAWAEEGVDHPKLTVQRDGTLALWLTGFDAHHDGTIAVARWDAASRRFVDARPIVGLEGSDEVSFVTAAPFTMGGERFAIVRERRGGVDALVVARFDPDTGAVAGAPQLIRRARSGEVAAFDRDEVGSPVAIVAAGVLRVYYAARRGTRWAIGVMVSDDAEHWRDLGEIAGPTGTGFDALGRSDPAVLLDTAGQLRLFYAAHDGVRTRIGELHAPAPN